MDTAGTERFDAIVPMLYRKADAFVLVYDITERSSFENLTKWLNKINHYKENVNTSGVKVMVIANKADLDGRNVFYEEGMKFAEEKGMRFFETSAKTGVNINQAFEHLVNELTEHAKVCDAFESFLQSGYHPETPTVHLSTATDVKHPRRCCSSSASTLEQSNMTVSGEKSSLVSPQRREASVMTSGSYAAVLPTDESIKSPPTVSEFTYMLILTWC